ncbi:M23 family metallopeptidase [Zooshikella harenae]|uniref:M23 family metallopeptidase n=1 Tax=Zooshikella harenae TaxID=2827238 RepID=A0ABS5ZDA1_9GAMM|nr:M23 family metallopeptidase [Zooshikella harenae]MBU2711965.1 M23 family metallopeptidase [Zooshikella harenae]
MKIYRLNNPARPYTSYEQRQIIKSKKSFGKQIIPQALLTLSIISASTIMCTLNAQADSNQAKQLEYFPIQQLIYSPDEMDQFDLASYLAQHAPHLSQYAEVISHWSGFTSISPKVLLALMEQQSGIISNPSPSAADLQSPFGKLSVKIGFELQVEIIAKRLAKLHYHPKDSSTNLSTQTAEPLQLNQAQTVNQLFTTDVANGELTATNNTSNLKRFISTYNQLFPNELSNNQLSLTAQSYEQTPPDTMFQLPFPVGEYWHIGGAHTNTGSGDRPLSSLDFSNGGYWGSDTSNRWVSAAASGVAKVHSSCSLEITHNNGWSTHYYHLANIQVQTGDKVSLNQPIANYASNKSQALCNGGQSTGPHEHFSLKLQGRYVHLNDVSLSGYKIHTGRSSYDNNCSFFWLTKEGDKHCSGRIYNPGVDSNNDPDGETPLPPNSPQPPTSPQPPNSPDWPQLPLPPNNTGPDLRGLPGMICNIVSTSICAGTGQATTAPQNNLFPASEQELTNPNIDFCQLAKAICGIIDSQFP